MQFFKEDLEIKYEMSLPGSLWHNEKVTSNILNTKLYNSLHIFKFYLIFCFISRNYAKDMKLNE